MARKRTSAVELTKTPANGGGISLTKPLDHLQLTASDLRYQGPAGGTDLGLETTLIGDQHQLQVATQH